MNEFSLPMRVYIEDTDAGGIVYYVNYLKFMERARTEWLRELGFGKAGANREGYQFVVSQVAVRYRQPARLDDMLIVTAELVQAGAATLDIKQKVMRGSELLAEGEVRVAGVDGTTLKPQRLPADLRHKLNNNL